MSPGLSLGIAAALLAAFLGAGWQVLTRHGVTASLGPIEIAVLRYGIPALALLPVLWRIGLRPAGVSWRRLAVIVAGGGLPFGLLVLAGAQFAPAAHIGIFMAGTMPLFTALACLLVLGEAIAVVRWIGFAVILAGVAWLGWKEPSLTATWRGDLLFLAAAAVWACHTVAFRGSGLTPWQGAAVANGWSALGLLLILPFTGAPRLFTAPWREVALQALGQGVLAGLVGLVAYMTAVRRLGSARAALSAALVPPLTAVGAAAILAEPVGPAVAGASLAVAVGIALASGVWAGRTTAVTPARCGSPPAAADRSAGSSAGR
jgi:drug/metabolite transporter (DMT)-like permease